jgi:hypothetical protein
MSLVDDLDSVIEEETITILDVGPRGDIYD